MIYLNTTTTIHVNKTYAKSNFTFNALSGKSRNNSTNYSPLLYDDCSQITSKVLNNTLGNQKGVSLITQEELDNLISIPSVKFDLPLQEEN